VSEPNSERYPNGRLRTPLGVREGGAKYEQVHAQFAREALRLMADLGYDGMSMDDVADAAGASKRTVYRHYATKVDLAVAAIEQLPTFRGWSDGDDDLTERIRRSMEIGAAHHNYFVPVLANAIVLRNTVPELLAALKSHVLEPREQVIRELVEYGQFTGEIRDGFDPALVSEMLTGELIDDFTGMHPLAPGAQRGPQALDRAWPLLRA
jgi:AcrR family transcriptional regulator